MYIARALASVVSQTYSEWECILVDDGSTDGSVDVVAGFRDPRIRIIRQENSGPAMARNRGAAEAKGEWIALLDADDYWLDSHLQNLARLTGKYPECDVVVGNFLEEYNDGRRRIPNILEMDRDSSVQTFFQFNSYKGPLANACCAAIKAGLWKEVGGFRETLRLAEDLDLFARLSLHTDFAICHEPSAVYFQDLSGNSTRGCFFVGEAPYVDLAPHVPSRLRGAYREWLARVRLGYLALGNLLIGDKPLVRKMAMESLNTKSAPRAMVLLILSFFPTSMVNHLYRLNLRAKGKRVPSFTFMNVKI